jgi:hypothetical protein
LSDEQFTTLINAAGQLHPRDRDRFLRAVAHRFDGCGEVGHGEFARDLRELLHGGYYRPPPQLASSPHQSRRKVGAPIA